MQSLGWLSSVPQVLPGHRGCSRCLLPFSGPTSHTSWVESGSLRIREEGRAGERVNPLRSPDEERASVQSTCFPRPRHAGPCTGLFGPSSLRSWGQQQKSPEVQVLGSAPQALEMYPSPSPWSQTSLLFLVSIPLCLWLCLSPSYFHSSVQTGRVTVPSGSSGARSSVCALTDPDL